MCPKLIFLHPFPPRHPAPGIKTVGQLLCIVFIAFTQGCRDKGAPESDVATAAESQSEEGATPSNQVDAPESVRRNLGITFAKVEARQVAQTIRAPGQFELQPEARREYRTMLDGRIELLVKQFDAVEPGQPLYRLASPQWRDLQEKLNEGEAAIQRAEARAASIPTLMVAHQKHEESLKNSVALWNERVEQLDKTRASGVVSANELTAAASTLATQQAQLAEALEKQADLEAQRIQVQTELQTSKAKLRLLLATASTLLGLDEEVLLKPCEPSTSNSDKDHHHEGSPTEPAPYWREIDEVEIRATLPGVIESIPLTNGAWASAGTLVLTGIDPNRLRFRAMGLQSDLRRFEAGQAARIVPPKGGSIDLQDAMDATFSLGLTANPQERTIELIAIPKRLSAWARPGVSAHLEVITAGGQTELAIPLSSVIRDGLSTIIFRRDPNNPDKVIRMDADLGINDGRWVVIQSGVREGDEVVLDGVYQLMIATSGSAEKGGHFHSDGSFHKGEDK